MIDKRAIWMAVCAAVLVVPSAASAGHSNAAHNEKTEKHVKMSTVPTAAMDAAKTKLASVTEAELVTGKDGGTYYELKGKTKAGKTMEVQVTAEGKMVDESGY